MHLSSQGDDVNSAHERQSRPDSGLDFSVNPFNVFLLLSEAVRSIRIPHMAESKALRSPPPPTAISTRVRQAKPNPGPGFPINTLSTCVLF